MRVRPAEGVAPPPPPCVHAMTEPDAAPTEVNAKLKAEAQLRAPDAIMEPGIGEVVNRYLHVAKGKPEDVIDMLSDGYTGARARSVTRGGPTQQFRMQLDAAATRAAALTPPPLGPCQATPRWPTWCASG